MKRQITFKLFALLMLLLALLPASVLANGNPQLRLSAERLQLKVGQEVVVRMVIEQAPTIYGVESHLSFDPATLEVTALDHGDFLTPDPEQEAFILQNRFDNEAGTLDYALTLLNPAPAIEGDGLLASVTFRAKAEGPVSINVTQAAFGTQEGVTIPVPAESAQLTISGGPLAQEDVAQESAPVAAEAETAVEANQSPQQPVRARSEEAGSGSSRLLGLSLAAGVGLLVVTIGLIGLAGFIGGWFWLRRRRVS